MGINKIIKETFGIEIKEDKLKEIKNINNSFDKWNNRNEKNNLFKDEEEEKFCDRDIKLMIKTIIDTTTKKAFARTFIENVPLYYDKSKIWWFWHYGKKCWEIVDEIDILNLVSKTSQINTIKTSERQELINALKQEARENKPLEAKNTWIQFEDEIIDIETGERFESDSKYFITNTIPYYIGKSDETPNMDKIFEQWVGIDNVKLLYEIIAYSLLSDYPIHRIFCLLGAGMNGKSCFLNLLRKFIGKENVCSTELDNLLSSRFEVTRLHNKLVCQIGETNFNEMSKTSLLKKLSGGDLIPFEYKNKDPFESINYAKILISTNNLPSTNDKTIGFYRRWLIIDFNNQFDEKKNILEDIPEEEYNNLANKSINILIDLLKNREFSNEGSIEERMKKYENKSNPIKTFLEEYCSIEDADSEVTKAAFEKKLNEWLKDNKMRSMSDVAITKYMKTHGFEDSRGYMDWYENDKLTKKRVRIWLGVKFK